MARNRFFFLSLPFLSLVASLTSGVFLSGSGEDLKARRKIGAQSGF